MNLQKLSLAFLLLLSMSISSFAQDKPVSLSKKKKIEKKNEKKSSKSEKSLLNRLKSNNQPEKKTKVKRIKNKLYSKNNLIFSIESSEFPNINIWDDSNWENDTGIISGNLYYSLKYSYFILPKFGIGAKLSFSEYLKYLDGLSASAEIKLRPFSFSIGGGYKNVYYRYNRVNSEPFGKVQMAFVEGAVNLNIKSFIISGGINYAIEDFPYINEFRPFLYGNQRIELPNKFREMGYSLGIGFSF